MLVKYIKDWAFSKQVKKWKMMEYYHFIDILQDKDDDVAYAATKRIAAESEFSDKYYKYISEFMELLRHKKSYIRTRAMILCCSQARWDNDGNMILTDGLVLQAESYWTPV